MDRSFNFFVLEVAVEGFPGISPWALLPISIFFEYFMPAKIIRL